MSARKSSSASRAVTIGDVARAAQVSTTTVSKVINGLPRVGAQTRQRVLEVVAELGYQVNPTARNLRAGRTDAIGLLVPELDRPYFGQLATRLANALEPTGRQLVVQRSGVSRAEELAAASFARLRMYDGVIISVVGLNPSDLEQLNFQTPVVLVGERPLPRTFDHVMMDNVEGAATATAHLLERGSRHIVMLGGRDGTTEQDMPTLRTLGYYKAHARMGVPLDARLVAAVLPMDMATGYAAVRSLVDAGVAFDGIVAVTDVVAIGALRALADLGIRVPAEVQVVGFDNIDETEFVTPRLTTIDPGNEQIAGTVLQFLETRMAEHSAGLPRTASEPTAEVTIPARLVIRESTRRA
jgi:DNA-binding LacI/PurR family transcriptional regulator